MKTVVLLVCTALLVGACTNESPSPPPSPSPATSSEVVSGRGFPDGTPDLSADTGEDVEEAAAAEGVPAQELTERMIIAKEFAAVVDGFAVRYPQSYAASGLVRDGRNEPWIAFKGVVPAEALSEIEALPNDTLVISDAPATSQELQTASAVAAEEISRAGATSVQARVDEQTLGITATYTGGDPARIDATLPQLNEQIQQVAPGLPPVTVEQTPGAPLAVQTTVKGGRALYKGGSAVCTAGFTAKRNGSRGLISAKHCPKALRYNNKKGVIKAGAGATRTPSGQIDLRFYRTRSPNKTAPRFRATSTSKRGDRTVKGTGNPVVGEVVCKWGRYTGYGCSIVIAVNMCAGFLDGQIRCGLAQTNTRITVEGDSGGPWFVGRTARGITTGADATTSVFTQISKVRANLKARVLRG